MPLPRWQNSSQGTCSGGSRISPRWGANPTGGREQHTILPKFPKNWMKLKQFGRPRGARVPRVPLRVTNDTNVDSQTQVYFVLLCRRYCTCWNPDFLVTKACLQWHSFIHNLLPLGDSLPSFRETSNENFFFDKHLYTESCLPLWKPALSSCARGLQNLQSTRDQHNTGKIDISGQFLCSISLWHIEPSADRHVLQWSFQRLRGLEPSHTQTWI